jgi:hypothetical protein
MKTPEEWKHELCKHGEKVITWGDWYELIEAVQRDALTDTMADTTAQEEFEMTKSACEKLEIDVQYWKESWALMRDKWHEARRYLRAANKGAERNNQVMRLQSYDISRLLERIKELQQSNQ